MVPKINSRGSSFKGAAAYLLHDKGQADTSERVAWVETVNMATSSPQTAWRVMAATALDAGRLKAQAGVKKTGRSSKDAVLHVTLAWSPEQTPGRAEMSGFAHRALDALKAGDRQAMIICHTDEEHPHVHLLINRVSPVDGRLLSSSKEKAVLSALALAYEQEGGTIYCKQREENAERRKKGEFVRGEKDIPRAEYEAMQDALTEVEEALPETLTASKAKIMAGLRAKMKERLRSRLSDIHAAMRPSWASLYRRQRHDKARGRQEKDDLIERSATVRGMASVPFLQQTLKGLPTQQRGRRRQQEAERSGLKGALRQEIGKVIGKIKQLYARALEISVLRSDPRRALANPPDTTAQEAGGMTLTPIQRRAAELSRAAKERPASAPTQRNRDREYEP